MYERCTAGELAGMGFSLKPPSWLVKDIKDLIGGKPATVPTPGGNVTIVPPQPQQPTPVERVNTAAESIPGGWVTIGAVALGAFILLPKLLRGSRR